MRADTFKGGAWARGEAAGFADGLKLGLVLGGMGGVLALTLVALAVLR